MIEQRIIVILGYGRSGTSFVSGWLYQCRLNLGSSFRSADESMNVKGFFEDKDFIDFSHYVLSYSRKFKRLLSASYKSPIVEKRIRLGTEIVEKKMLQAKQ